jgi:hypothetical protein
MARILLYLNIKNFRQKTDGVTLLINSMQEQR